MPGDVAVQQRQCPRNVGLAQTGKPSSLTIRQRLRVTPDCLDEQQLRKLGKHGLRSWTAGGDLLGGILEGRADPFRGSAVLDVKLEQGWQRRDHRIAFGTGATEKPADHPRASAAAAMMDRE